MPSQAELDAQNNASRARQQARRGIEPQVPEFNPNYQQFGINSIQDQDYYDNYYDTSGDGYYDEDGYYQSGYSYEDDEEMTDEEWAAYLAELGENPFLEEDQEEPSYYSDYGSRMPDGPIEASYPEEEPSWWSKAADRLRNNFNYLRGYDEPLEEIRNSYGSNLEIQQPEQEAETPFLQYLQENTEQSQGGGANEMEQGEANKYGKSPQRNYYDFVQGGGQMNDEQIRQANEMARSMGTTFDPETGYSRQPYLDYQEQVVPMTGMRPIDPETGEPLSRGVIDAATRAGLELPMGSVPLPQAPQVQAPMSVRDTQAMLQERFGSPTVSGNMNPSINGLETDAQGRMIPGGYEDRIEAYLPYEKDRYERELNQANRRDFSTKFISGADSRDERNDMPDFRTIARQAGLKSGAVNEQAKILEAKWRSDRQQDALNSPESRRASIALKNAQTTKILNELSRDAGLSDFDKEVAKDLIPQYNKWRGGEQANSLSNIEKIKNIIQSLDKGDVETGGFINKLPVFSEPMRLIFDESGQDSVDRIRGVAYQSLRETLGAQFTENEAKNLVATYFNPGISSKMNIDRLSEFGETMQTIHNSKNNMYQYMTDNQSLKGYKIENPKGMIESLVNGRSSSSSSTQRSGNGGGFQGTTKSGAIVIIK